MLFVAAASDVAFTSEGELKQAILQRLEVFNARQYVHEAITDKRLICVVEQGVLPRTVSCWFSILSLSAESYH